MRFGRCRYSFPVVSLLLAACAIRYGEAQQPKNPDSPYKLDTPGGSQAETDLRVFEPGRAGWLFPATHLNSLLPSWLQFGSQFRNRVEAQTGINYERVNDVYDLTQFRVGVYISPLKWLKVVGVAQDSRVFFNHHVPNNPSYQNIWDLREASLQLGSSEGWVDLVAGRQLFSFGDERVIGPADWSNMGRTFDAVRLNFHHAGIKTSVFASSAIFATDGVIDHHLQGNNLYGVYSSLSQFIPHATLEPYVIWRIAPGTLHLSENAGLGHLNEVTWGARLAGNLGGRFDYDVEMNRQTGSLGSRSIAAWAGHWNAGYTFARFAAKPRPFLEYNYASGTRNPNGREWNTHDQIYPSAHNKLGFADLFGWRNISNIRAGASEKLGRRWDVQQIVNASWLATKNDALYDNSGIVSVAAHPNATSRYIGTELDLVFTFKQSRHITYGFGLSHLFTGTFLNQATSGKDVNYPFAYSTYVF